MNVLADFLATHPSAPTPVPLRRHRHYWGLIGVQRESGRGIGTANVAYFRCHCGTIRRLAITGTPV